MGFAPCGRQSTRPTFPQPREDRVTNLTVQYAPSGRKTSKADARQGSRYGVGRARMLAKLAGPVQGWIGCRSNSGVWSKAVLSPGWRIFPADRPGYQGACRVLGATVRVSGARAEAFWRGWLPAAEPPRLRGPRPSGLRMARLARFHTTSMGARGKCGCNGSGHFPAAGSFDRPQRRSRNSPSPRL
jgi:hypothetical protein